jgi:hypothetical protein
MSLTTLTLGSESASLPFGQVVEQARGGIQVKDTTGQTVAFVLPPNDLAAWTEAEALREFEEHRDEIRAALAREGGITTRELLQKAPQGAAAHSSNS